MNNKQCEQAQKEGKCTGVCDQCTLDGNTPRKEFGIGQPSYKPTEKLRETGVDTEDI